MNPVSCTARSPTPFTKAHVNPVSCTARSPAPFVKATDLQPCAASQAPTLVLNICVHYNAR